MNLVKKFHHTVIEIGILNLKQSVFYQAPNGIRFEIGGEADVYIKKGLTRKLHPNPVYVNEAVERASTIFNALPKKDWILRIDLYNEKEIKKLLKVLQFVPSHEKVLNEYIEEEEKMTRYELYWSLNDINWSEETIIRNIILADIGGLNCLSSSVYVLNPAEKILFHLYDDRGLDIVARDQKKLYPVYKTFNNWILDYDRELIDKVFSDE